MASRFTVINKDAMVLIAYDNGATKTYPKNAYSLQFDPQQPSEDSEAIYITGVGSPTSELLTRKTFTCRAIIDEVAGTTPAVGSTLNDLYLQLLPFFFRELASGTWGALTGTIADQTDLKTNALLNRTELIDGESISANCLSYAQKLFYLESAEVASTLTISNVGIVVDLSINKQGTDDLVITLAGTGLVFDIYDSTNKCYTEGTTVTLSRAVANTTFKLNFVVTGLIRDSDTVVQVAGTFTSFA